MSARFPCPKCGRAITDQDAAGYVILPAAEVEAIRDKALEPFLWQCKDYADGWIDYFNEAEALAYQRDTGCALRITYRPSRALKGAKP